MVEVLQLSDGRTDGTTLGQPVSAALPLGDKIAFFGASPIVQPSAGGSFSSGLQGGTVITFATTQSPASVATLTTAELGFTVVGGTGASVTIASGDMLYINKPTSQASLGVGNVRVSSAGVAGVTFSNISAGFLTPTASEVYGVVALRGIGNTTVTISPAAVAADTIVEQQFTVTGLRAGLVQVTKPTSQPGLDIVGARVVSTGVLGVTFMNTTAATTITPTAAEAYVVLSLQAGLNPNDNNVVFQVSSGTLAGIAAVSTGQDNVTVTNLAVTDVVLNASKPTSQAGLFGPLAKVSSAGFVGFVFSNVTSSGTLTPTANEVYGLTVTRPNPAAPMLLYNAALTPVSVAANVMAEQTFTVTGLVAGSPVWVNKPSAQTGLGIAGVRVSSANTLAINYVNTSSAAIVPTAETYVVGNFQMPLDTTGSSTIQATSGSATVASATALRAGLIALGLFSAT